MIRLYHCVDARSFRPLWALEELGLRYELTVMPFPPRRRAKEFMAINPLGTIPAFVDAATFVCGGLTFDGRGGGRLIRGRQAAPQVSK